jgi:Na+-transporting NADH:ubiquinone oxidoreductase subunit NqrC
MKKINFLEDYQEKEKKVDKYYKILFKGEVIERPKKRLTKKRISKLIKKEIEDNELDKDIKDTKKEVSRSKKNKKIVVMDY